ncbi:L,D-transpeptidase [Candidatus Margulisiibacteriota bacterium]
MKERFKVFLRKIKELFSRALLFIQEKTRVFLILVRGLALGVRRYLRESIGKIRPLSRHFSSMLKYFSSRKIVLKKYDVRRFFYWVLQNSKGSGRRLRIFVRLSFYKLRHGVIRLFVQLYMVFFRFSFLLKKNKKYIGSFFIIVLSLALFSGIVLIFIAPPKAEEPIEEYVPPTPEIEKLPEAPSVHIPIQPPSPLVDKIVVVKSKHVMYLYKNNEIMKTFKISVGKNSGDKQEKGDWRTPEGTFKVVQIHDSKKWSFDFEDDDEGPIVGAYGPWFIRLKTPWEGIGIHGTHDPNTIGKSNSHGCIRLYNKDVELLKELVYIGLRVEIRE